MISPNQTEGMPPQISADQIEHDETQVSALAADFFDKLPKKFKGKITMAFNPKTREIFLDMLPRRMSKRDRKFLAEAAYQMIIG